MLVERLRPCCGWGDEPEPMELVQVSLSELPKLAAKGELNESRALAALFLAQCAIAGQA